MAVTALFPVFQHFHMHGAAKHLGHLPNDEFIAVIARQTGHSSAIPICRIACLFFELLGELSGELRCAEVSRDLDFILGHLMAKGICIEDLEATGFEEIWLADFQGIFVGAHRGVRLFGLYPEEYRVVTERVFDQKPYG